MTSKDFKLQTPKVQMLFPAAGLASKYTTNEASKARMKQRSQNAYEDASASQAKSMNAQFNTPVNKVAGLGGDTGVYTAVSAFDGPVTGLGAENSAKKDMGRAMLGSSKFNQSISLTSKTTTRRR